MWQFGPATESCCGIACWLGNPTKCDGDEDKHSTGRKLYSPLSLSASVGANGTGESGRGEDGRVQTTASADIEAIFGSTGFGLINTAFVAGVAGLVLAMLIAILLRSRSRRARIRAFIKRIFMNPENSKAVTPYPHPNIAPLPVQKRGSRNRSRTSAYEVDSPPTVGSDRGPAISAIRRGHLKAGAIVGTDGGISEFEPEGLAASPACAAANHISDHLRAPRTLNVDDATHATSTLRNAPTHDTLRRKEKILDDKAILSTKAKAIPPIEEASPSDDICLQDFDDSLEEELWHLREAQTSLSNSQHSNVAAWMLGESTRVGHDLPTHEREEQTRRRQTQALVQELLDEVGAQPF